MTTNTFNEMTKFLWEHRNFYYCFSEDYLPDYPDYAFLPKSLSRKLSPEAVDALQEIWTEFVHEDTEITSFKKFQSVYRSKLRLLGERIK